MNDIEKTLQKYDIKKANNIDVTEEELFMVNSFFSEKPFDEKKAECSKVVKHPLIKCKEFLPVYFESFKIFIDSYHAWKNEVNDENYEKCCSAFLDFNLIQLDFFDLLVSYGDFEVAIDIPELPRDFVISHKDTMEWPVSQCLEFSVPRIELANSFIEDALREANKGKCMTLAPYINGCCSNILFSIKKVK